MVPLIVDADTAGDDAVSLLVAAKHPNIQLLAVTVCAGNVDFQQQVCNTLYTLQRCHRNVPVYMGARQPLSRPLVTATEVHGDDGMGNSHFPTPSFRNLRTDQSAAQTLVRLCGEQQGRVSILAQAPLTNIAQAIMLDSGFVRNVHCLYIMGGTYNSPGNVTPDAEYNFYADPEAAEIVLAAGFAKVLILDWGISLRDGIWDHEFMRRLSQSRADLATFVLNLLRTNLAYGREKMKLDGCVGTDSVLASIIAEPSISLGWIPCMVRIDVSDSTTRGKCIVNNTDPPKANAYFCAGINTKAYQTLLYSVLTSSV